MKEARSTMSKDIKEAAEMMDRINIADAKSRRMVLG
jgi:hypothetical protein